MNAHARDESHHVSPGMRDYYLGSVPLFLTSNWPELIIVMGRASGSATAVVICHSFQHRLAGQAGQMEVVRNEEPYRIAHSSASCCSHYVDGCNNPQQHPITYPTSATNTSTTTSPSSIHCHTFTIRYHLIISIAGTTGLRCALTFFLGLLMFPVLLGLRHL